MPAAVERSAHRARTVNRQRGCAGLAAGLLVGLLFAASCTPLSYYRQSLWGGARVLLKRRAIRRLLADPDLPATLRGSLELVSEIRDFASAELGLPDNRSYRSFAALHRRYALWNVVATPELDVKALTWCFPVAGCVAYRGYFHEAAAHRFARRLRRRDRDVYVYGVTAYSTLGWFADPVLDTFLRLPAADLAGLLFHELAHQVVYAKGDTVFNESFASLVEIEGVRRWLGRQGRGEEFEAYLEAQRRDDEFAALLSAARERLATLFASDRPDDWKRAQKARVFEELRQRFDELAAAWGGTYGYDAWFEGDLNNARLAAVGAYHDLVPAFEGLLRAQHGDLPSTYEAARRLARLSRRERQRELARYAPPLPAREAPPSP